MTTKRYHGTLLLVNSIVKTITTIKIDHMSSWDWYESGTEHAQESIYIHMYSNEEFRTVQVWYDPFSRLGVSEGELLHTPQRVSTSMTTVQLSSTPNSIGLTSSCIKWYEQCERCFLVAKSAYQKWPTWMSTSEWNCTFNPPNEPFTVLVNNAPDRHGLGLKVTAWQLAGSTRMVWYRNNLQHRAHRLNLLNVLMTIVSFTYT